VRNLRERRGYNFNHKGSLLNIFKIVNISVDGHKSAEELLNHYQQKNLGCSQAYVSSNAVLDTSKYEYTAEITIEDSTLRSAFTLE
jgi:hypothetical protein